MKKFLLKLTKSQDSIIAIITNIVTGISFLITFLSLSDKTAIIKVIFGVSIILIIITLIIECIRISNKHVYKKKDKSGIAKFMEDFISCDGEVVIFSNTLSWIDLHDNRKILEEKADNNELTIFLPHKRDEADALKRKGAKIYYYSDKIQPKSRFTIVNFKQSDSSIAISAQNDGLHTIEIYRRDDAVAQLAHDFTDLMKIFLES